MGKVIVHVGLHRTGSSSIQDSLAAHLRDPAFRYLRLGHPNASLLVRKAFSESWGLPSGGRPGAGPRAAEIRAQARQTIVSALEELGEETGIVSAEDIGTLTATELDRFLSLLRRRTPHLTIAGYVRRLKSAAESAFQQRLKTVLTRFDEGRQVAAARQTIERFDAAAEVARVEIWPYDPPRFPSGDVVLDFCGRLGIAFSPDQSVHSNASLTREGTRLLYLFRRAYPEFRPSDRAVVSALGAVPGPRFHFHSDLARRLALVNPATVDWLSARVGADMSEDLTAWDDVGVRSEADLATVGRETREWLARATDRRVDRLEDDDAIAEAVGWLGARAAAGP